MRAFFCIPLTTDAASAVADTARAVRDATDMRAGWIRTENYHVTLRFLGEIDPLLTVDLERAARRVSERLCPFDLPLERLGCFPSVERARVLWLGGDAPPQFHGLSSSLHHELRALGFPPERKATVAHVTLARIKGRPDSCLTDILNRCTPPRGPTVRADRLVLMQSTLAAEGAVYTPVLTARFGG